MALLTVKPELHQVALSVNPDDVLLDDELPVEDDEPVPVPVEIGPAAYNATPENITELAE